MKNQEKYEIIVSKDNKNNFCTLQSAIEGARNIRKRGYKGEILIIIKEGFYNESVVLDVDNIIVRGEERDSVVISNNLSAFEVMEDGKQRGTFSTSTFQIIGSFITLNNLTIENTAGCGKYVGQCVALYADGDKINVENCILKGNQDTLFTAPLPQADKNGSNAGLGPLAIYERKNCRQIYRNCTIVGNIDFIFGGATALFIDCSIFVLDDLYKRDVKGYIAAACTTIDLEFGYLFYRCKIDGNVPKNSVYLARPWRVGAKTVFFDCDINFEIIHKKLFHDWDKRIAHETAFYALDEESSCNSNDRVEWSRILDDEQKDEYLKKYFQYLNEEKPKRWKADKENI